MLRFCCLTLVFRVPILQFRFGTIYFKTLLLFKNLYRFLIIFLKMIISSRVQDFWRGTFRSPLVLIQFVLVKKLHFEFSSSYYFEMNIIEWLFRKKNIFFSGIRIIYWIFIREFFSVFSSDNQFINTTLIWRDTEMRLLSNCLCKCHYFPCRFLRREWPN